MLFFDEADAMFGRRGEVRDARDRWANLEVNYLLQRIEDTRGVVILATNLRQNIDDAFQRRIHVVVEFPVPDAASRRRCGPGCCRARRTSRSRRPTSMTSRCASSSPAATSATSCSTPASARSIAGSTSVIAAHLIASIAREHQKTRAR